MRRLTATILTLFALTATAADPAGADPVPPYGSNFGLSNGIIAAGSPGSDVTVLVTYFGWEATTAFGHSIWAFTASQYTGLAASGCFGWLTTLSCSYDTVADPLFGYGDASGSASWKGYGTQVNPHLGGGTTGTLQWIGGEEIIFALLAHQGNGWSWWFSGDPSRNRDGYAHLGFFSPAVFPNGVPEDPDGSIIPQSAGKFLFGFEDNEWRDDADLQPGDVRNWDFNNALFGIEMDQISPPSDVVPEPATMTLLATGLAALAAAGRRRKVPPAA